MMKIVRWMAVAARDFESCGEQVRREVDALCREFPTYHHRS